jgi:Tol biopolymer transport system component/DNA-binding winged helix-turn-helix (wHTH) protein
VSTLGVEGARMGETGRAEQTTKFGIFEVDLRSGELRKSGSRIKLQEQPFKVLQALLERPGEVVTRNELRRRIWPDENFGDFDHAVNVAITKLRAALGDSAESPHLIETLHRRGYRFIFPVDVVAPQGLATPVDVRAPRNERTGSESHADISISPAKVADAVHARGSALSRLTVGGLGLTLAVVGTFAWLGRPLPVPRVLGTTQVTHDRFDKWGVLNDGARLYVLESTGSQQFLVQASISGGETSVIPTPFANIAISDISPDHSQLLVAEAIGTENQGQAWILPLPSGAPRRLGEISVRWSLWSTGWAVWSPDGHRLAFTKGSEIDIANADGSDPQRLTALTGYATELCFSPDSTRLRFTLWSPKRDSASIWEVHTDGSNPHPVLPGWHDPASQIAGFWSADGRYYFFTKCDDSTHCSIWALREAKGLFQTRASSPMRLTTSPTPVFLNGISPDGKKLFAGEWSTQSELVRYDARSRQFAPFLNGISATELDFSRDGKWVTYVSSPGRTLWRSRADGSERLQLTSPPISALLPRWSPDGTQIAFVDEQAGPFWKIFLISARGGAAQEMLRENRHQMDPSWSPDGKQLVFGRVPWLVSNQEKIAIQILDLGSRCVWAIPGSENLFAPRWSPDGQHLAAVSMDNKRLMLFDFTTRKWTQLVD